METSLSLSAEAALMLAHAKALGLTQLKIAKAVGASQSQVSRILAGVGSRRSKLFQRVCKYVFSLSSTGSGISPQQNVALMAALADVWDGTPAHADALALVIRSLNGLRHPHRSCGRVEGA